MSGSDENEKGWRMVNLRGMREKDFLWEIRGILKGSVLTVI